MRAFAFAVVFLMSCHAHALTDKYGHNIYHDGSGTYTRDDGTVVKQPTEARALETFAGLAPSDYVPVVPKTTTIETGDFVARFTPQEIAAVMAWNPAMVFQVSSAKIIDVTSPRLRAGLAAAVAAGALTQARVDQLLTP